MKKRLLIFVLTIILAIPSFNQQWLYFPSGCDNNRIDIGNLAVPGESITIEAIITLQTSTPLPIAYDIISKHYNAIDCNYFFRPTEFAIRTSSGFIALQNPNQLCFDTTYHVAGTYDGDSIKYLINGVQVASQHWTGTLTQNNHTAGIGNMHANSIYYEQFIGYIDEVRIWNVARSPVDIASNMYNLSNPTSQTGLMAYYKFDGSYNNIQGNSAWDGISIGGQLSLSINPLFNGSVSNNFCNPTGIFKNPQKPNIFVSPNPFSNKTTIKFPNPNHSNYILSVFSITGNKVFEMDNIQSDKIEFEKGNLPKGVYLVELKGEKVFRGKMVVK
ncbi:MAG: T9SS type A sorting domain-containing protein [Bacteroidales bacterium]|nr:T9SS type A sorting domain-containing protein [Bacteroidales bacterium]